MRGCRKVKAKNGFLSSLIFQRKIQNPLSHILYLFVRSYDAKVCLAFRKLL
jgi:hypothetical protein